MNGEERREEARVSSRETLHLLWEDDGVSRQARARLVDVSPGGIGFRTHARLRTGQIVYCASPAHGMCTRAMISHTSRSLFTTTVGARLLATL